MFALNLITDVTYISHNRNSKRKHFTGMTCLRDYEYLHVLIHSWHGTDNRQQVLTAVAVRMFHFTVNLITVLQFPMSSYNDSSIIVIKPNHFVRSCSYKNCRNKSLILFKDRQLYKISRPLQWITLPFSAPFKFSWSSCWYRCQFKVFTTIKSLKRHNSPFHQNRFIVTLQYWSPYLNHAKDGQTDTQFANGLKE